jgi:hypothetical protein
VRAVLNFRKAHHLVNRTRQLLPYHSKSVKSIYLKIDFPLRKNFKGPMKISERPPSLFWSWLIWSMLLGMIFFRQARNFNKSKAKTPTTQSDKVRVPEKSLPAAKSAGSTDHPIHSPNRPWPVTA